MVSEFVEGVFRCDAALGDWNADLQNSVIDKTVVLKVGADKCQPKPLGLEEIVIAASERMPWIEVRVNA